MGTRWMCMVGFLVLAACSDAAPEMGVTPDAGGDVQAAADVVQLDAALADTAPDVAKDAAPAGDAGCVPKTQVEACGAGANCGYATDGCGGGYACGPDGGVGNCGVAQTCGLQRPNVCGGCQPLDAAGVYSCSNVYPMYANSYSDCPSVTTDAGVGPYMPPGCINDVNPVTGMVTSTVCCHLP